VPDPVIAKLMGECFFYHQSHDLPCTRPCIHVPARPSSAGLPLLAVLHPPHPAIFNPSACILSPFLTCFPLHPAADFRVPVIPGPEGFEWVHLVHKPPGE
jgi:hypothetical protein